MSRYNNGEYFVVRQTTATLYCVKLNVGYGGHSIEQFALIGERKYSVIESWTDNAAVRKWASDSLEYVRKFRDGETKREWIDSVYTQLEANVRSALRVIDSPSVSVAVAARPLVESMDVLVPAGVKKINLRFD